MYDWLCGVRYPAGYVCGCYGSMGVRLCEVLYVLLRLLLIVNGGYVCRCLGATSVALCVGDVGPPVPYR